jgi:hypothetical protein
VTTRQAILEDVAEGVGSICHERSRNVPHPRPPEAAGWEAHGGRHYREQIAITDGRVFVAPGNPLYTYRLKQGIEDGFLAPYRVHHVVSTFDAAGWRPTKGHRLHLPDR